MCEKKITLLVLLFMTGCSSIPSAPAVPSLLYKIDIQQGNVITQEMVDKLKPGMTRSQVRFVLGTALIDDVFHKNRWDYVYRLEQHGNLVDEYKLTVFFEDDKLVRTEGDFTPSFASVSPKLTEPAEYPAAEAEPGTDLLPEPDISDVEKVEDLPSKPSIAVEQDTGPTISAIKDDTISQGQAVTDDEPDFPPPPPGIADGIEAD